MNPATSALLGPFLLGDPLAAGGMARVFHGVDTRHGNRVAVKVMTELPEHDDVVRRAFHDETRAVASLDHPNIIAVLDHGFVPETVEALTDGRVKAHTPYLVMELADGGSLMERTVQSWAQAAGALRAILDALAHAHARDIIHLDLKAANVLFTGAGDPGETLKLTDFGIAYISRLQERPGNAGAANPIDQLLPPAIERGGTPRYMSPEQFYGAWRDYGPWTDLYALGCLAFELVVGHPPFSGSTFAALMQAHCQQPPPPVAAKFPVPPGLESWLHRLLEKSPGRRFQRAADAAWMLATLRTGVAASRPAAAVGHGDEHSITPSGAALPTRILWSAEGPPPRPRLEPGSDAAAPPEGAHGPESVALSVLPTDPGPHLEHPSAGSSFTGPSQQATLPMDAASPSAAGDAWRETADRQPASSVHGVAPPLPHSWEAPTRAQPARTWSAGPSLFGLRRIPIVNRVPERNLLWRVLADVTRTGQARAIVLRGPAGTGKSRLAAWLAERAHEVGAAIVLRATHHDGPARDELARAIERHHRCQGLDRAAARDRISAAMRSLNVEDASEALQLLEVIAPEAAAEPSRRGGIRRAPPAAVRFDSQMDRFAVIRRWLERLTIERPVVLWLDDVQWGPGSLAFVEYLLQVQKGLPAAVLVVMTVQAEALPERPLEAARIDALAMRPGTALIDIGPLEPDHHAQLVRELLGLEPVLAGQVVERTAGNPLFAVQWVGDWVQRGWLETGVDGLTLQPGVSLRIPDTLHSAILERLQRFAARLPRGTQLVLEIAAAMGPDVDNGEWTAICAQAEVPLPAELPEVLTAQQLIRPVDQSASGLSAARRWTFVHGLVRESLERQAREADRWADHHRQCARYLEGTDGRATDTAALEARLVWEHALEPLQGAIHARQVGHAPPALTCDPRAGRLAHHWSEAGVADRAIGWGIRALATAYHYHRHDETLSWTANLRRWLELQPDSARRDARWLDISLIEEEVLRVVGRNGERPDRLAAMRAVCQRRGLEAMAAEVLLREGRYYQDVGQLSTALERLEQARAIQHRLRDRGAEGMTLAYMASAGVDAGHMDRALQYYQRALELHREVGDTWNEGITAGNLGMFYIQTGQLDAARECLTYAHRLNRTHGYKRSEAVVEGFIGLLNRARGRIKPALNHGERSIRLFGQVGARSLQAVATSVVGSLYAEIGHFDRAMDYLERSLVLLRETDQAAFQTRTLIDLCATLTALGRLEEARAALEEARTGIGSAGAPRLLLMWHSARGRLQVARCTEERGSGQAGAPAGGDSPLEDAVQAYAEARRLAEDLRLDRGSMFTHLIGPLRADLLRRGLEPHRVPLPANWDR